jgi:hypothetical protein
VKNIPIGYKIYIGTDLPQNIPNSHVIYHHIPLQVPPKFTQIGIFGLEIYYLATLGKKKRASIVFNQSKTMNWTCFF